MIIDKANNQYYGQFIEEGIVSVLTNKKIVNNAGHTFSNEDIKEMIKDCHNISQYIKGDNIEYIGRQTSNEAGDIKVDGKNIELKYVSQNKGTYYNTSISYFSSIGLKDYKQFLLEHNYYELLEKETGIKPNRDNNSPYSIDASKNIRYNMTDAYKKIMKTEKELRDSYTSFIFNQLIDNKDLTFQVLYDMINKTYGNKKMPDVMLIYNYINKDIKIMTKDNLTNLVSNVEPRLSGSSIILGNVRITLAWQNGTGLNNPTIRVFLI